MLRILGADRAKLSKRHGVVSITDYRDQGYLSENMVNFLALLGWSLNDRTEILSRQEIINNFSLERVSRTAAPPLFQTMAVLGKEQCLERIKAAIDRLRSL